VLLQNEILQCAEKKEFLPILLIRIGVGTFSVRIISTNWAQEKLVFKEELA
jgi:hypothetical protein